MRRTYTILSPDGFSINREGFYTSRKKARTALFEFIKRYEKQGFYSLSNRERITLTECLDRCQFIENVHLSTLDKILCPVSSKYGAPMGRDNVGEKPTDGRKVYESFVRFYDGDYDKGGAYWGGGRDSGRLFVQYTRDLSYIRFYRVAYP